MSDERKSEQYLSIEKAGGARWHPDGKRIVFVADGTGVYQVYETMIERGKVSSRRQLTSEEDRCTNPRYLHDESIIFVRDRGGNENFQIGLIDSEYQIHWLTDDLDAKHILYMSTGEHLYFLANREDRSRLDLHEWALPLRDTGFEVLHRPKEGHASPSAISDSGEQIVLRQFLGNVDQHLLLLERGSGAVTNLTEQFVEGRKTRWDATRWLDNEHLLVLTDHESDRNRPAVLSLSGDFYSLPELEQLMRFEVEEFAHRKDSKWTYFVENQDGYSTIHRGVFRSSSVSDVETLPFPIRGVMPSGDQRSWTSGIQLSHDEHRLAVTLSSGIQPTSVWILDIKDMVDWRAVEVSTAGLNPKDFSEPTLHDFKSFDGTRVPYFRYIPHGKKPSEGWPAILVIHGGPESQMRPEFNPVHQFYVSGGFALVAPNIRGSTGYGRGYLDADNVEKRLDSIMDIKQLALHLRQADSEIDGERLVIYGGSYGGFAVLSAMTEYPELWKCGVDIVGISNFVTFLSNTAAWRRSLREAEYGSLEHDTEALVRISPINQIVRIAAPLMIIQGDNDERVPLSESIQIHEKLREKGVEVRLLRFDDEGHGLARRENRIEAYTEVLSWLRKNV